MGSTKGGFSTLCTDPDLPQIPCRGRAIFDGRGLDVVKMGCEELTAAAGNREGNERDRAR